MIRALEFYSGIGGLHLALQRSGVHAEVVRAFDWDPAASQVYTANWGKDKVQKSDIAKLSAFDLASLRAALWLLSPACQPYTVLNPDAKGAADPRAASFLHLVKTVLPDLAQLDAHPRWILVENVAGFETSTTRQTLLKTLIELGYVAVEFLLTPLQFSIPNSRLRYYLLAKLRPLSFANLPTTNEHLFIKRSIPGHGADWVDPRQRTESGFVDSRTLQLVHFLDDPVRMEDPEYWQAFAVPDAVLRKKGVLFDIVLPHFRRSCCFTSGARVRTVLDREPETLNLNSKGYTRMVEGTSILQMNEMLDTIITFDSYTAALKTPDNATDPLHLLRALRLRYFTPDELLRLFNFIPVDPRLSSGPGPYPTFHWPADISQKTKYRLIGNSVNVKVVQELILYLFAEDAL